jgi:undecaprenyl-diphosphatase
MDKGNIPSIRHAAIFIKREFRLLVTILVILAALCSFLILAEAAREGTIQRFDDAVLLSLRQDAHPELPRGPQWLPPVMRDITSLGGEPVIVLVTLVVVGYLWLRQKYRDLVLITVAALGGGLLDVTLKEVVGRGRPAIVPHFINVDTLSFPSGHSMMSMVVYLVLAILLSPQLPDRRARSYVIMVALLLTFLIGISRVYLGVHYPSDVLGGWLVGLAWAAICWLVSRSVSSS